MSKCTTQDMAYRQSLMKYAEEHGVGRASRKYNKSRSYICFWKQRRDGATASLAGQSRRPHSHPNRHIEDELKRMRDMRRRNPELGMLELWHRPKKRRYTRCPESLFRYTAIDEVTRLRFLAAYPEQSTCSSADFLRKPAKWYAHRGIRVECVQTDNGFEFTNRFSSSKRDKQTLFERTAAEQGIRHKRIRLYTPRHNGKAERSHREDQKRFYSSHSFYSLDDFAKQLTVHLRRSNNLPMRSFRRLSPNEFAVQYV